MSDAPIELGGLGDLGDGQLRAFAHVGRNGVVVCRVDGRLYALDDQCSHAETPLSEGRLRGHALHCPRHGTSFDVRTGVHSGPPAWEGVACHEVREVDGVAVVVLAGTNRGDDAPPDGGRLRTR